jgi:hypothetical protein
VACNGDIRILINGQLRGVAAVACIAWFADSTHPYHPAPVRRKGQCLRILERNLVSSAIARPKHIGEDRPLVLPDKSSALAAAPQTPAGGNDRRRLVSDHTPPTRLSREVRLAEGASCSQRTTRMSHDEERARGVRLKPQPDRAPRHWLDPLVSPSIHDRL